LHHRLVGASSLKLREIPVQGFQPTLNNCVITSLCLSPSIHHLRLRFLFSLLLFDGIRRLSAFGVKINNREACEGLLARLLLILEVSARFALLDGYLGPLGLQRRGRLLQLLLLEFEVLLRLLIYNGNDLDYFLGLQVVVRGRALAAA
jgi:hypothetical protein